ncbi:putative HTH transcriptional regulator [Aequitasia blattaphilus]|uniref:FaeA/PapI family transcriptional regulator n=1 Tax=Aequitasia blattaphilus TaxID=2949332 RepID=UPI003D1CD04F
MSDQLGSDVRNLFKYGKLYSGVEPKIIEDDVFRIVMPLDDEYSFNMNTKISDKKSKNYVRILAYMKNRQAYKTKEIAEVLGIQSPQTRSLLNDLVKQGKIEALGGNRNRTYKLKE